MLMPSLPAQDALPTVYRLGEQEDALEQVQNKHQQTLLDACNGNLSKAFTLWLSFLKELEAYAEEQGCKLDGVSIWIQVFFSANGQIEYIGYYPKPNSRTMEDEQFRRCLQSFITTYRLPLTSEKPYYNYTDVRFPLVYELYEHK